MCVVVSELMGDAQKLVIPPRAQSLLNRNQRLNENKRTQTAVCTDAAARNTNLLLQYQLQC